MDTLELYRRAQDGFDAVMAAVEPDQWDAPSMCTEWTVRDVAGHVIWGQRQLRAWALDEDYRETAVRARRGHGSGLVTIRWRPGAPRAPSRWRR